MFSKELENLIQATLEDGVLEDYEKAALVKRATAEGVDIDELEIYINSILQKRQKENRLKEDAIQAEIDKKKKEAFGRVCPSCGKQVPPMTLVCECGYEFTSQKSVSSVQLLADKIEKINSSNKENKEQEIRDAISVFPVPNTKEDIIEFLALSTPNAKRKGGIFGTVFGRMAIFVCIVLVIYLFYYMLLAPDFSKYVFRSRREEFMGCTFLILGGGIAVSTLIALNFDKETLKWNKNARIWRAKFDQVLMKGRSLRGDTEFSQQLDYYESRINEK